jgi:hypothetical protein
MFLLNHSGAIEVFSQRGRMVYRQAARDFFYRHEGGENGGESFDPQRQAGGSLYPEVRSIVAM